MSHRATPHKVTHLQSVVLASSSPQRKALLQQVGIEPVCVAADIDESRVDNESAADYVQRLAVDKCQAVQALHPIATVIGADTTISIANRVLGKAADFHEARETLSLLSGTQHSVLTGVCIANASAQKQLVCETIVEFGPLSDAEIRAYWESGEPQGKAGCYAIQGLGAVFVKAIRGSYSNVVGLPLHEVATLLQGFGIKVIK